MILIVACDLDGNIGKDGDMPWGRTFKEDLKRFKLLTIGKTIVMGRKTFESIGSKPLPDRENIVLSQTLTSNTVKVIRSLNQIEKSWIVIGGEKLYNDTLHVAEKVYLTLINDIYDGCDAKFPLKELLENFKMFSKQTIGKLTFFEYIKVSSC